MNGIVTRFVLSRSRFDFSLVARFQTVLCARNLMQPVGVARGLLGLAPFVEHRRRYAFELGVLLVRADIGGELDPVAVGIEEVDRLEDAVMSRAKHIDALRFYMRLGSEQFVFRCDPKGEMGT